MAAALFVCLFAAFFLLCVPFSEYEVSPASAAVDAIKRRIDARLTAGEKGEILSILGRNVKDLVKTGLLAGIGLALLMFLLTFKILGPFSAVLSLTGLIAGVFLTERLLESEYRKWQGRLLDGIPTLVNFVPAFLEVEGVTPREALAHTVPFISEPMKGEMWRAINKISRTGRVREAMDALARKAKHPLVDAICFRLSAAWDAKITSDIFADLADQIDDVTEMAVQRATTAKTGLMALVCVLGLIGMLLEFGYPGCKFLMNTLTKAFMG